jgi:hypothetical protein
MSTFPLTIGGISLGEDNPFEAPNGDQGGLSVDGGLIPQFYGWQA